MKLVFERMNKLDKSYTQSDDKAKVRMDRIKEEFIRIMGVVKPRSGNEVKIDRQTAGDIMQLQEETDRILKLESIQKNKKLREEIESTALKMNVVLDLVLGDCKEDRKKVEDDCEEEKKETKVVEEAKKIEECLPLPKKRKSPHDIKRASCYPRIPKKSNFFCRLFKKLGIKNRTTKPDGINVWTKNSSQIQTPAVDFRRSLHEVRRQKTCNRKEPNTVERASYKEQRIYGQKVTVLNTGSPEEPAAAKVVSVPFRSPMPVILGYYLKNTKARNLIHTEYIALAAKKEASKVLNLFSDRYKAVRGAHDVDCTKNETPVTKKEQKFQNFGGSPEETHGLRKFSQTKSAMENPHFEEKKRMTHEIAEELVRRIRYRKKAGEKVTSQILLQRADHDTRSKVRLEAGTKESNCIKTPKTNFESIEMDHHGVPEIKERHLRMLSQKQSHHNDTKFVKETPKHSGNGLAVPSNIKRNKNNFTHQIKQTTVKIRPNGSEKLAKETASGKSTMRRIMGESSLKKKAKKLFKELEREADRSDRELKKSRKVVICKSSPNHTSPKFLHVGTTSKISRDNKVNSFRQERAQERAPNPSGRWSGIETIKYHKQASASHKQASGIHLHSSALHQQASSFHHPSRQQASPSHQTSGITDGAIAKPEHPKKRKFKPILLDILEEPNLDDGETNFVETRCNDFNIDPVNHFAKNFTLCSEYAVDPFTPMGDKSRYYAVENTEKSSKAEEADSEEFRVHRGFLDELGWELTSYDRQIVNDCRRRMMKLTLVAEHKDKADNQKAGYETDDPVIPPHEKCDSNEYNAGKDELQNDTGGHGDGIPRAGDNSVVRNVVRNKIQPGINYDKIWTWQDD